MAGAHSFISDSALTRSPHYSEHSVLAQKLDDCFSSCRAGKSPPLTPTVVQDLDSVSYALTWTADHAVQVDIHCPYILPSIVTNFVNSILQDIFSDITPLEGSVGIRLRLPRSFRDKNAVAELLQSRTRMLSSWLERILQSVVNQKSSGDAEAVSCSLLHPNLSTWTDPRRRVVGLVSLIPRSRRFLLVERWALAQARRVNPNVGWALLEAAIQSQTSLSTSHQECLKIGFSRTDAEDIPFPQECSQLLGSVPSQAGGPQTGREYRYLHISVNCELVYDKFEEEEEISALLDELVNLRHTVDHIVRTGLIEITAASRVGAEGVIRKVREGRPAAVAHA